jgi:hypothetical protein
MLFDVADEINWFDQSLRNASLRKLRSIISLKGKPILIGGCGRSGTSLLLSILSAHPNIYGISEETNIFGSERKFKSVLLNRINNKRKLLPYLLMENKVIFAQRWCEKTPRNVRYLAQIKDEFNNEFKFIHIIRDGRDVVTSIHPLTGMYHVSIERWISDVKLGLLHQNESNVYTIKYENIIMNQ